ncbi:Catechol 2,3-dioxygenase [Fictibacillus solisalsi]|uniref:Catechol 2,3-dioxygenase n=1 Tax=Fictibacillus solisalsi TaxID=459525 RepID=A0A1G9UNQ5_9BACL|nr:VOC family protein [Fictibacillus solisalsi]SDM61559.1 Catechol 2,3-dioxygenase [Fictibacillus solisalsi]
MKVQVKGIHHVQLCIPPGTEDQARSFFSGILGFQEIEKPDSLKPNGGLWYQVGKQELHLGIENIPFQKRKSHPAFEVAQLDAVKKHLVSHGLAVTEEIEIPGLLRFSFRDPFGNRIEFLEKTTRP